MNKVKKMDFLSKYNIQFFLFIVFIYMEDVNVPDYGYEGRVNLGLGGRLEFLNGDLKEGVIFDIINHVSR